MAKRATTAELIEEISVEVFNPISLVATVKTDKFKRYNIEESVPIDELHKTTRHLVEIRDIITCDCEAYKFKRKCKHIPVVEKYLSNALTSFPRS